jgi:phage terminase large subunit
MDLSKYSTEELTAFLAEVEAENKAIWQHPSLYLQSQFGFSLYDRQIEIIESVRDNNQTAVHSANNTGKTHLIAGLSLLWALTKDPSYVIILSSKFDQVQRIIFPRIRQLLSQSKASLQGIDILDTRIKFADSHEIIGQAVNKDSSITGYHAAGGVLVIVDEASGFEPDLLRAVQTMSKGENNRLLLMGNPVNTASVLYRCTLRSGWNNIYLSAFDSPNVKQGRTVISGLADLSYIESTREEYGEESFEYRTSVLGQYPIHDESTLFPSYLIEKASLVLPSPFGKKIAGLDPASTRDKTVLVSRQGNTIVDVHEFAGNLVDQLKAIIEYAEQTEIEEVYFDSIGLGEWIGPLTHEFNVKNFFPVDFRNKATDSRRYSNLRAELFFKVKDALDKEQIHIPKQYLSMFQQLHAVKSCIKLNGQKGIIEKKEIKKVLGHSCDHADALAYSFASDIEYGNRQNAVIVYDIFKDKTITGIQEMNDDLAWINL